MTGKIGPKKKPSQIKVYLRCDTLALVSKWLNSAFTAGFDQNSDKLSTDLRWFCDRLIDLGTKGNTGTRRLDIDRTIACWLVNKALPVFQEAAPQLLIQRSECRAGNGAAAFAEIMIAIKVALDRGEGRPQATDPIEAHEVNEWVKRKRVRANYNTDKYRESAPAHEVAAKKLGVSKNTLYAAAAKGRDAALVIAEAKASLPSGAEPLLALVDYKAKTVELIAGKKTR